MVKSILKDGIRLARLKRSIGLDHVDPRPLFPIQVARYMEEMKEELDDPSNRKTAKRLEVSTGLISDFLGMLEAPPIKYDHVWGWGPFKGGRLPWSMCRRMGKFYAQKIISEEDFGRLVNGAQSGKIPTSSIEEIVYLKKKNPKKSFNECCKEISNLIPEKITSIVFIADLDSNIIEKIKEKARKESKSEEEIAESVLSKYLGDENLEGVLIKNDKYIKIALNKNARQKLDEITEKENKTIVEIISYLFLKEGFGNG